LTERQLRRRSTILSAARELIGKNGYDNITMRELARESGVAYKTLYDVYGSKDNLLGTAVEERLQLVFENIVEETSGSGFERLMQIMARSSEATIELPNLARALEPMLAADPGRFSIRAIYEGLHRQTLNDIDQSGDLVDWADIDLLLRELMLENTSIRLFWANKVITDEDLAPMQQFAVCKILMPVARGKTGEKIAQNYRRLQRTLRKKLLV
jgi:TetR/AcrR family transcriptional regulator, cholesterol catabolism regulator